MRSVRLTFVVVVLFQLSFGARMNSAEFRNEATAIANRIQAARCKDLNYPVFHVYWVEGLAPPPLPLAEGLKGTQDACEPFGYHRKFDYSPESIENALSEAYLDAVGVNNTLRVAVGIECNLVLCSPHDAENIGIRCFFDLYTIVDPTRELTNHGLCRNKDPCRKCFCPPPCFPRPRHQTFKRYKTHRAWPLCHLDGCASLMKEHYAKGRQKYRVVFDYAKEIRNCLD